MQILSLQFSFAQSSNFITAKFFWRPYFKNENECVCVFVDTKVLLNENYITLGCTTWKKILKFKWMRDFLHFYTTPQRLMLYEALRENEIFIIFNVSDNWNELWAEMFLPS